MLRPATCLPLYRCVARRKADTLIPAKAVGKFQRKMGRQTSHIPFGLILPCNTDPFHVLALRGDRRGGGPILTADIPLVDEARKGRRLRYRRHHLQRPIDATQSTVGRQPLVCAPRRRYLAQVRSQSGAVWGGWGVRLGGGWGGAILLGA